MAKSDITTVAAALVKEVQKPIKQGSFIPPEPIEKLLGVSRDKAAYSLAVVGLRGALEAVIEKQSGRRYWTRQLNGGIKFLTTAEAATFGDSQFDAMGKRRDMLHHKIAVVVDPYIDELTPAEQERYRQRKMYRERLLLHEKETELSMLPDPFTAAANEGED